LERLNYCTQSDFKRWCSCHWGPSFHCYPIGWWSDPNNCTLPCRFLGFFINWYQRMSLRQWFLLVKRFAEMILVLSCHQGR